MYLLLIDDDVDDPHQTEVVYSPASLTTNVNKELQIQDGGRFKLEIFHFSSHKKRLLSAGVSVLFYSDTIVVNGVLTR